MVPLKPNLEDRGPVALFEEASYKTKKKAVIDLIRASKATEELRFAVDMLTPFTSKRNQLIYPMKEKALHLDSDLTNRKSEYLQSINNSQMSRDSFPGLKKLRTKQEA